MKQKLKKRYRFWLAAVVVLLTMIYLMATGAVAQESPKTSGITNVSYTKDSLSYGDIYAFDQYAFDDSMYSAENGINNTSVYNNSSSTTGTTTGNVTFYQYYGTFTGQRHTNTITGTEMKTHEFTQFRSGVEIGTVEAPVGNGIEIPVATTSGTGVYSVVPSTTGTYRVYFYSPSGSPNTSQVKYTLINNYTAANSYTGSPATSFTSITPVGDTGWYYGEVTISGLGWTAYAISVQPSSGTSDQTAAQTWTGGSLNKTSLTSKTYYYNVWSGTAVQYDTVLAIQFPSTVSLGPITKTGDSITINNTTGGTVTAQDIFGQTIATDTAVSLPHMPVFLSAEASSDEYTFTGIDSGSVEKVGTNLYQYNFESAATMNAKWEKAVAFPSVTVTGGALASAGQKLDFYLAPSGSTSFVTGQAQEYVFSLDFTNAEAGVTVSYSVTTGDSGTFSGTGSFSVSTLWDTAVVTLTATNAAGDVTKNITYTITSDESSLPVVAKIGTTEYRFLEDALVAAANTSGSQTIVLVGDYTMYSGSNPKSTWAGDKGRTVASGDTLLIPYSSSNTTANTTSPATVSTKNATRYAYKTLTIPSGVTLTVNGSINVNSQIYMGSAESSFPTGPYGLITLEADSGITLNSGANLYCWGFINGDGTVTAKSGATVYECFQIWDWRGGTTASGHYKDDDKVALFSQYYIQNIEAALTLESGASEKVFVVITLNNKQTDETVDFIGSSSGMFQLTSGTLTKKYNPATDRLLFEVDGNLSLSTMQMSFSYIITVNIDTANWVLPINSNISIDIQSGTTTMVSTQDLALLPGAELKVSKNATLKVASNVYVYDQDQWGNYAKSSQLVVDGYTTTNGTTPIRTSADLVDAAIDVNGILDITGKLYTTQSGANIFSSEGTGQVKFSTATKDETNTYQWSTSDCSAKATIPCTTAQLRNGDGSYTQTTGAQAGWTYYYDTDAQRWYRFRVTYQFNGTPIGYDLITGDSTTYTVDFATDLNATVDGGASAAFDGTTLTVSGISSDCTVNITGTSYQYQPSFVLNEEQYSLYQTYTGGTLSETVTVGGSTYYVVQAADAAMNFGSELTAPADVDMGVTAENHNRIQWFLEDTTTGAQVFMGVVPRGETQGGPVYIYGIYSGYVAYNSFTDGYYTTLKAAVQDLPVTGSATLKMLANCGTFAEEDRDAAFSMSANITFDLNGHEAWGSITNNGTLLITDTSVAGGGRLVTDVVSTSTSVASYAYIVRNNASGTLTMNNVTLEATQTTNNYLVGVFNLSGGNITQIKECIISVRSGYGLYNYGGTIDIIDGGSITGYYGIYNRNYRTVTVSNGVAPQLGGIATIDTIKDVNVTCTYQYALWNGGIINTIGGSAEFHNTGTGNYIVYNSNTWYYDSYVASRTDSTSGGYTRTDTYIGDDAARIPTIGSIQDSVVISSNTCSYGLANYGNIDSITGNVNIAAKSYALAVVDGGRINTIDGTNIVIQATAGERGLSISGSRTAKTVTTYLDKVGGTTIKVETTYGRCSSIGTITGNVAISTTTNYAIINYGTIDSITGAGVTLTANQFAIYNVEGGRMLTKVDTRTDLGQTDEVNSGHYLTLYEYEYTYNVQGPYIGTIDGITATATGSNYAINNQGTIGEIKNVTAKATANAIYNGNGHYTTRKTFTLKHCDIEYGTTDYGSSSKGHAETAYIGETSVSYTRSQPSIGSITNTTATTTSTTGALVNYGIITTISDCSFTAKTYYALQNGRLTIGYELNLDDAGIIDWCEVNDAGTSYVFRVYDLTEMYGYGEISEIIDSNFVAQQVSANDGCAVYNLGSISSISGSHVTVEATSVGTDRTYALRNLNDVYSSRHSVMSDITDALKNADYGGVGTTGHEFITQYIRTYSYDATVVGAFIDSIENVAFSSPGRGINNYGTINNITGGSIDAYREAIYNVSSGYYTDKTTVQIYHGTSRMTTTTAYFETAREYTSDPSYIKMIDGLHATTTTSNVIYNEANIGTIQNCTLAATTSTAIYNVGRAYQSYVNQYDNGVGNGVAPQIFWDGSTYKMASGESITTTTTFIPSSIELIGGGNTLSGTTTVIYNLGHIKEIAGGGTTTITATTGTGIYLYRGLNKTEVKVANVIDTTQNEYVGARINKITGIDIHSHGIGIQNGSNSTTDYNTYGQTSIGELGEGVNVQNDTYSSNAWTGAVRAQAVYCYYGANIEAITGGTYSGTYGLLLCNNADTSVGTISGGEFTGSSAGVYVNANAKLDTISGGVFTATGSSGYGLQNNGTANSITITASGSPAAGDYVGPYFVGKNGAAERAYAIYEPDTTTRQTYLTGYTLSANPISVTGRTTNYYYIAKNEFTLKFDANSGTGVAPSDVVVSLVETTAPNATLPANTFTYEGYQFAGWGLEAGIAADSDALLQPGSVAYTDLGTPSPGAGDVVTVYAIWKPDFSYSITVTWTDMSFTYSPAVYQWNGQNMQYEEVTPAAWVPSVSSPEVTVTNNTTDPSGIIQAAIAYTANTGYAWSAVDFTVGSETTSNTATLSDSLTPSSEVSASIMLTGTPPADAANPQIVGTLKLTLTPAG